jgi:predicted ribosomally synthesized peptide with SipW-like signal peptide
MKKVLIALMVCVLALGLMGSAFAYFTSTATATANTFTAGTVKVNMVNGSASTTGTSLGNLAPGNTATFDYTVVNTGSLAADVTITPTLSGTIMIASNANDPVITGVTIGGTAATDNAGVWSVTGSLAATASETVVVTVSFPSAAGDEFQGLTGTLNVTVNTTSF